MNCPNCQTANPDGAKFCRNCGNSLTLSCTNCKTPIAADDRFCTNCGQPTAVNTTTDETRLNRLNKTLPTDLANKIRAAEVNSDRKVVTALFADVVGSTSLAEQFDAEEWTAIMNRAFDLLSPPIYRYEGSIARLLGDAILAFFGAPITHEDDPVRAVHAARELIEAAKFYAAEVKRVHGIKFAVRVGINTGPVVVGRVGSDLKYEYTAMGDAVNLAARMQSSAQPMTVLISQHTAKFAVPFFDLSDQGLITIKGKAEPVRGYEVGAVKAIPDKVRGLIGLESKMVGRNTELAALSRLSSVVKAGAGRVVAVIGEPGLGKSRLMAEWKAATSDMQWAEGQCLSYGRELAYHLALSMLRSLTGISSALEESEVAVALQEFVTKWFPDGSSDIYPYLAHMLSLPLDENLQEQIAGLDPQSLQAMYGQALRQVLLAIAASKPLTIILEDIHWADPSSVDLITKLLPLVFQARILFCFVTRAERDVPGWKLVSTARDLLGETMLELQLVPLSESDSHQLISNLLEIQALPENVRALIYHKAEGNPFFVEEVIRMLIDRNLILHEGDRWVAAQKIETIEIPDNLLGLLLARIDRQPDAVKYTMRVAAVIGRQFPVKVLEQVMAQDEVEQLTHQLSRLESANLIQLAKIEPELEYLFRHALIQDAAYESLLKKDRQRLHRAVARILDNLYVDRLDEFAPVLGHHYAEAGHTENARKYFQLAADNAVKRYANSEAIAHYTRAIDSSTQDDMGLWQLYLARGQVYEIIGDFNCSRNDYEFAQQLSEGGKNPRAHWQATLALGMLWAGRDYQQAGVYFRQALSLAEQLNDPSVLGYSLNRIGNLIVNQDQSDQGIEYHLQALELFRKLDDQRGIVETLDLLGMAGLIGGRNAESRKYYAEAADMFTAMGDQGGMIMPLIGISVSSNYFPYAHMVEGNVPADEALRNLQRSIQIAVDAQWRSAEAFALSMYAALVALQGNIREAMSISEHSIKIAREIEHQQWLVLTQFTYSFCLLEMMAHEEVIELLQEITRLSREIGSPYWERVTSAALALAYVYTEALEAAESIINEWLQKDDAATSFSRRQLYNSKVELELQRGQPQAALASLDKLLRDAHNLDERGESGIIQSSLLRGRALTKLIVSGLGSPESPAQAEAALDAALNLASFWPQKAVLWKVYAARGHLFKVLNREKDSQHEFDLARANIAELAENMPESLRQHFDTRAEMFMMEHI
jgi:class 3 adenylate cyclase/tetratricopeptide (TPR) repeat protein